MLVFVVNYGSVLLVKLIPKLIPMFDLIQVLLDFSFLYFAAFVVELFLVEGELS